MAGIVQSVHGRVDDTSDCGGRRVGQVPGRRVDDTASDCGGRRVGHMYRVDGTALSFILPFVVDGPPNSSRYR